MPATLLAVAALLIAGGTAAPARADSGDMPEAIAEQPVDVARGIAAEASLGDEAANGLAAPAGGTLGIPSPSPSGQEGAAPAHGQAGAAPSSEEPSGAPPDPPPQTPPPPGGGPAQQSAPTPAGPRTAGAVEPAPLAPAAAGSPELTAPAIPTAHPLVADEPVTKIHDRREPPEGRSLDAHAPGRPAPQPAPAEEYRPAPLTPPAGSSSLVPFASAPATTRKTGPRLQLRRPAPRTSERPAAPGEHPGAAPLSTAAAGGSASGNTASPGVATLPGVTLLALQGLLARLLASRPSWRLVRVAEPPERPG